MTEHAVLFDQTAFRVWLQQPSTKTPAAVDVLADGWQRHDGQGGWLATVVLDALHDEHETTWVYGPGVSDLKLWVTEAPESGPDGGVTAEVLVDGVRLSLGHIPADELIATEQDLLPGYEAAELALAELAERVNLAADAFRQSGAAPVGEFWGGEFGALTGVEVRAALISLAELFSGVDVDDLSGPQLAVTNKVIALWRESTVVDAEIVED